MSPGSPEQYTPPSEPVPQPPPPPMIGDAAQEWTLEQDGGAGPAMYHAPPPSPAPHAAPVAYAAPPGTPRTAQGLAITALVMGIVAFVTGWIPVWGAIVGVVAVIFGVVALGKRQSKAMAITGIVTGALGAAVSVLMLVLVIVLGNRVDDYADDDVDFGYGNGTATLGPVAPDGGLAVAEQNFGSTSYDDGEVWWVVILDNPSTYPYPGADITVNALDSAGRVVDSSWDYLALPSGRTALTGVFFDLNGARVASLEVVGPDTGALASEPDSGMLSTSELAVTTDEWSTTVSGTVTSSFSEDLYGTSGVIVARDASGEIIAAAPTYTDGLANGESASFEAFFYDAMPADATFEAFWSSY